MDQTEEIISKLRGLLETDPPELTAPEMRKLRAMIAAYDMFLSSGRLGRWFMTFIVTLAAFIAAFIKLADWLQSWARGA